MGRSFIILLFMLFGLASPVNAENGDQYWLFKAGASWLDNADKPDYLQALNITYGYGLSKSIAAEIDYQQSAGGGKYANETNAETGKYAYKLASIGAAYRYVFYERLYFRGKVAVAYGEEQATRTNTVNNVTRSETEELFNLAGGLALGVLAGDIIGSSFTLELEYIRQSDTLSSVLLGANLTF